MTEEPRVLVTMHYPLEMHCVSMVMTALADAYPDAVIGEDGTIWSGPPPRCLHGVRDGTDPTHDSDECDPGASGGV